MPITAPVPQYMQPKAPVEGRCGVGAARAAVRYSIWLGLFALVALSGAFWVATRPWLLDHDAHPYLEMIGYSFRANGKNCDVVLYGDSTALAGLDPAVIQSETGLTACNVSETKPILDAAGVDFPLDQYLAHNRPPKFLITAWAPGDFNLEHPPMNAPAVDGYLYVFQYDRGPWLWKSLLRHPKEALSFLVWVQGSILENLLNKLSPGKPLDYDQRRLRDSQQGMWQSDLPAQTNCVPFPPMPWVTPAESQKGVSAFRQRYASRAQHLLIDITPVADCFEEGKYRIASVQGLHDNTAQLWPVSNFNSINIHLTPQGAQRFSAQVARQIEAIQQQEHQAEGKRGVANR